MGEIALCVDLGTYSCKAGFGGLESTSSSRWTPDVILSPVDKDNALIFELKKDMNQENKIVDISRAGLGLDVFKDIAGDDDDHLLGLDEKRSLNNALLTEHLRAVRVLLVELGYATSPSPEDKVIGGLGLSGSKIQSPFSDLYFLNSNKRSPLGVAINSPIETTIRRQILKNNWYVV